MPLPEIWLRCSENRHWRDPTEFDGTHHVPSSNKCVKISIDKVRTVTHL